MTLVYLFAGVDDGAELVYGNYLWKASHVGEEGNDFFEEVFDLAP